MWLVDRGHLSAEQRATLEREVLPLGSLQDLVRWAFSRTPPTDVAAVHVQDEFCHDVVLPWIAPVWLVFDTT
jgi:hypothetical protein